MGEALYRALRGRKRVAARWLLGMLVGVGLGGELRAQADQQLLSCVEATHQVRPGRVLKTEFKRSGEQLLYEFNVRDDSGRDWDVTCRHGDATIVEIEREVSSVAHPVFKAQATISESEARDIAREVVGGYVVEVEYEVEDDGRAVYEFDFADTDGVETKIEVDAATGEVIEIDTELWQIGYE